MALRTSLADLERVFVFGEREICFVRSQDMELNPALPFAIGSQTILPKHYWEERDITKTTVEPPLGSGPYRLKRAETGRLLEFELDEDYWGRDIPVNRGRYNFKRVKYDYFNDDGVMLEAPQEQCIRHPRRGRVQELGDPVRLSGQARRALQARSSQARAGRGDCGGRSSGIPNGLA